MEEQVGHDKEIEDRIFEKYRELRKVNKDNCGKCNVPANINNGRPVSFFVVGKDFKKPDNHHKIMFVGKTVQNKWEEEDPDNSSGFIDARRCAREKLFVQFWSNPFLQCIKEICRILWKTNDLEVIWRRIAITNLVKCSTSKNEDTTPPTLKENCITKAKFFEEEVKIIKPTHIVLFTGHDYDKYLEKINFKDESECMRELKNTDDKKVSVMWRVGER